MKRAILGALVLAGLASYAAPASAQYYGGGGGRYYQEEEEYEYRPRPRRPPPGYGYYGGGNPYRGGGYGGGYRQRVGSVCVTSRGNCSSGRAAPVNTPCGCFIPGFGRKRGAIGF